MTRSSRLLGGVCAVAAACALLANGSPASARPSSDIRYGDDDWHYMQVAHGQLPGFQNSDSQDWPVGRAGFGTTGRTCSFNTPKKVKTPWSPNTDMLLSHLVELPDEETHYYASRLDLRGTVDHSVDIYFNGEFVTHVDGGSCAAKNIDVDLAPYQQPGFNELEMRAISTGSSDYIDVRLTDVLAYDPD